MQEIYSLKKMLNCYNRGCGQSYDPNNNDEESCRYHTGMPYFHDAYKGWTCCNKKSVDFTEFLNIKGCTLGKHSNQKPPEIEKPQKNIVEFEEPKKPEPPKRKTMLERPSFDSSLTEVIPTVLPALRDAVDKIVPFNKKDSNATKEIEIGTNCKNGGCKVKYTATLVDDSECQHHPGVPIFHEGLKYWSCCNKRTSDFIVFMNQPGCNYGPHKWISDDDDKTNVNCRYDWHQTPTAVIVAIYAKLYHYAKSKVEINPVRLKVRLIFPEQNDAEFSLDLELRGIIKVESATAKMYPTKIEITMPKAESEHWLNLNYPRPASAPQTKSKPKVNIENSDSDSEDDLDDIRVMGSENFTTIEEVL